MGLLYLLADMFIKTFGITQPTEADRRRAAFFILGLIVLALVGVAIIGVALHQVMR